MPEFDLDAFVAHAERASLPTGSYGCVYELWQDARTRLAYSLLGAVPDDRYEEARAALKEKGVIADLEERPDHLCRHWLDADTCPAGCFEHDERDHGVYDDAPLGETLRDLVGDGDEGELPCEEEPDWDECARFEAEHEAQEREEVRLALKEATARVARLERHMRSQQAALAALAALGLATVVHLLG